MNIEKKAITVIPAEKENKTHSKGVWTIFNEDIGYKILTTKEIPYEDHLKWWDQVFNDEYIYIIQFKSEICGYIRLTKKHTSTKEKHEISIAISKKYQGTGLSHTAYSLFESEMKKFGVTQIIAKTHYENAKSQHFFEKIGFEKSYIKFSKNI
ncbi:MAG: GNAT family N-acetyltransferase [Candidatus Lokiarchaeota archaeon]|nr:GNAT family N-acetyltransferase [Candidatus Lokiarchaeota archaeon]